MNINLHMSDKSIAKDNCSLSKDIEDRLQCSPKKTKVIFRNHDTGEVLGEYENKVVISGSQFNAMNVFGITDPAVKFPSYNSEMKLDNSSSGKKPENTPVVCLFCISDSGCGTTPKDVKVTTYTDRIKPAPEDPSNKSEFKSDMIMPFRYVNIAEDLDDNLRKYYFGKKTFSRLGKIGYYFKKFDTDPQLHLRYADGTQITENVFETTSDQLVECYVEMRLRITRLDFRDYFEEVLGWDKARISSLSLCFAWYDESSDDYIYYQDITPYTYLAYSYQWLVDLDVAIDIDYQIFY